MFNLFICSLEELPYLARLFLTHNYRRFPIETGTCPLKQEHSHLKREHSPLKREDIHLKLQDTPLKYFGVYRIDIVVLGDVQSYTSLQWLIDKMVLPVTCSADEYIFHSYMYMVL